MSFFVLRTCSLNVDVSNMQTEPPSFAPSHYTSGLSVGSKCSRSETDTRSKSVRSFYSKWITVSKYPFARGDSGLDRHPKVGQHIFSLSRSLALNPLPVGSPAFVYHKKPQYINTFGDPFLTDVVHNGLHRLVRLGAFLDERLWVSANSIRVQRGGSQVRCRVACGRGWRM